MISEWVLLWDLGWGVEYLDALQNKLGIILGCATDLNDDTVIVSGNR
jgi:hypothetical protein